MLEDYSGLETMANSLPENHKLLTVRENVKSILIMSLAEVESSSFLFRHYY